VGGSILIAPALYRGNRAIVMRGSLGFYYQLMIVDWNISLLFFQLLSAQDCDDWWRWMWAWRSHSSDLVFHHAVFCPGEPRCFSTRARESEALENFHQGGGRNMPRRKSERRQNAAKTLAGWAHGRCSAEDEIFMFIGLTIASSTDHRHQRRCSIICPPFFTAGGYQCGL